MKSGLRETFLISMLTYPPDSKYFEDEQDILEWQRNEKGNHYLVIAAI